MRIGELSRRTGVSIPTIKYYVREGLLPAGELTSPNQASYTTSHERRLQLIRALLDVGGLSVAAVRDVLEAIDDPVRPVHQVLGEAASRLVPRHADEPEEELAAARGDVAALIARRNWQAHPDSPAATALAAALTTLDRIGHSAFAKALDEYAAAAEQVARADLAYVARDEAREDLVESVVIGTVLGDAMFAALRRLAQTDASARQYEPPGGTKGRKPAGEHRKSPGHG